MIATVPARRGLLFVLSSPSGAGKSTLSRRLIEAETGIAMSVSATTRTPRGGEVDGSDYHFLTSERFDAMLAEEAFLEWANVFGNRYGTPARPVHTALSLGSDVLFDIDWQGTQQLRQRARDDVVSVFILPPSMRELERRMRARAQDEEDVIQYRMERAAYEISHWDSYDYVFVNDDLEHCLSDVRAVLAAERLRRVRQPRLIEFIRKLMEERG